MESVRNRLRDLVREEKPAPLQLAFQHLVLSMVDRRRSAASATWRLVGERWVLSAGALPKALEAGQ